MIQETINQNKERLLQLMEAISQLSAEEYTKKMVCLNDSSIGMHIRHIIEFYVCVQANTGVVNYDKRARSILIEQDATIAQEVTANIINWLQNGYQNTAISYDNEILEGKHCDTSIERELQYLLEHTTHHMALIRVAFLYEFNHIQLDKFFGFATSTIKHLTNVHSNLYSTAK